MQDVIIVSVAVSPNTKVQSWSDYGDGSGYPDKRPVSVLMKTNLTQYNLYRIKALFSPILLVRFDKEIGFGCQCGFHSTDFKSFFNHSC